MRVSNLLLSVSLLCLPLSAAAQDAYLDVNFDNGIPASFTQIDNDGNEPSASMKAVGFAVGTGWIGCTMDSDGGNRVACSTSWYSPAGTSDDWLITPAFTVQSADDILRWRAMAHDKRHRDGYAVYVTEGGAAVADFDTSQPLFSVAGEEAEWTSHSVSLAAYVGKTVRVAFVNNSTDMARLYLDDIFAGRPSSVYMTVGLPEIIDRAGSVTVTGDAYTENAEPVKGFTVTFEYDGQTLSQTFDDELTAGQRVPFTITEPLAVSNNTRLGYKATVSHGGTSYSTEGTLTALARKNLVEEGTGTWCGWCIRGIVAMANLAETQADRTVGVAVHNGDVMTDAAYDSRLTSRCPQSGFPKMMVNRNPQLAGDPQYAERFCRQADAMTYPYSGLGVDASYDGGANMVNVTTQVFFPIDADTMSYRLGYVLIENNVHSDDDAYAQNNSYEGGGSGAMGGYENKPSPVPASDMWYQEVARGFFGDFDGIAGSVPSTVKAMEPCAHNYSFTLPASVMKVNNAEVVALLIDRNNLVVNAEKCALGTPDGIKTTASGPQISIERGADGLIVKADSPIRTVSLVSADGRSTGRTLADGATATVSTTGLKGIHILTVATDKGRTTRKIVL